MLLKTEITQIRVRPWSVLVASNFLLSFLISFTVFHLPVTLSFFLPAFYWLVFYATGLICLNYVC